MKGWYKTSNGVKHELETTNDIYLTYMGLIELVIPDGVKEVVCYSNKLTKLIIPDSVTYINCRGNNLTELVIPNGVIEVYCSDNLLTELIVPDQVKRLDCMNNQLTELIVPDDCYVVCDNTVKLITRTMYNRSNRLKAILK